MMSRLLSTSRRELNLELPFCVFERDEEIWVVFFISLTLVLPFMALNAGSSGHL